MLSLPIVLVVIIEMTIIQDEKKGGFGFHKMQSRGGCMCERE